MQDSKPDVPSGATFLIKIQYGQNSSWQGTIQWLEEKKTQNFRSELELMLLMNEAAEKAKIRVDQPSIHSWEENGESPYSKAQ